MNPETSLAQSRQLVAGDNVSFALEPGELVINAAAGGADLNEIDGGDALSTYLIMQDLSGGNANKYGFIGPPIDGGNA
jgi:hypothetical protein